MNQFLSHIRTLQDLVNALDEEKELCDPETASSSGMFHAQSTLENAESQRNAEQRFWIVALYTEFGGYFRNVFESPPPQQRISLQELP